MSTINFLNLGVIAAVTAMLAAVPVNLVDAGETNEATKSASSEAREIPTRAMLKSLMSDSNGEPVVRVETPSILKLPQLKLDLVVPGSATTSSIAYLDEDGNLIARPPGSFTPSRSTSLPLVVRTFAGTSPGGGIGADISHIRSYSYATIGPNGSLQTDCVVAESLEEAQARVKATAARRSGSDHPNETESN